MLKKYVVELDDENVTSATGYNWLRIPVSIEGEVVNVETTIQLLPYIAPNIDLEQVRKDAYREGREDGIHDGMCDAWEAARKISMAEINGRCSWKSMKNIFGIEIPSKIFKNFTASEAIEKLKACEQEQGAEIKVGNEVKAFEKKPFIVTGFGYGYDEKDVYCYGFVTENGISTSAKKDSCVRTGRHFPEIAAIFEKMRERQK